MICARFIHQMPGCRPIAVAIEERADNATIQDSRERFVALLRFPFGHDFIAADEAANVEAVRIRRAAAETGVGRRVKFLKRLGFAVRHDYFAPLPAIEPGYGRSCGPV